MTKKNKDKISFDKRGFKTSTLANIMPSVMKQLGGAAEAKKSASLIRLINHWAEIIGTDMALKTMPLCISYSQQRNRQSGEQEKIMILKIKAESAVVSTIAMRQSIILERLNRLFGTENFKKLDIMQGRITPTISNQHVKKHEHFNIELPTIEDPVLKSRLESLGQAVMNSAQNKQESE